MRARKRWRCRSFVAVENNCGAHGAPSQYRAAPRRSQRFGELSASLRLLKMSKLQLKIQWFLRSRIIEAGRWGRPNYAWWCACEPTTTHIVLSAIHGFVTRWHRICLFAAISTLSTTFSQSHFWSGKRWIHDWLNKTCLDKTLQYLRLMNPHKRSSLLNKTHFLRVTSTCVSIKTNMVLK